MRCRVACRLALVVFVALAVAPRLAGRAAAQVEGNRYASPTYGFVISWDAPWYVFDEVADPSIGVEGIVLTDGPSRVLFVGDPRFEGDVEACASAIVPALVTDPSVSNFQPMVGADGELVMGGDAGSAYAAFTYTVTDESGQAFDNATYVECRALPGGEAVLQILHVALTEDYESEVPAREALVANLVVPSPGEPAPAFVSGGWRMAVVGAQRAAEIAELGLDQADGQEWIVLVLDVTAWGREDAVLRLDELTLGPGDGGEPIAPDREASAAVAEEVGAATWGDGEVPFGAGETRRIAVVFPVTAGAEEAALVRLGATLPLASVLAGDADLASLPPVFGPPALVEVQVDQVVDGDTLEVTFVSDGSVGPIDLLGVAAPTGDACYAAAATDGLRSLVAERVWLEAETEGATGGARYVWTEKRDGTRILVNRKTLERGLGEFDDPGEDARFGAWLADTARLAEAERAGLWSTCAAGGEQGHAETPAAAEPEETEVAAAPGEADLAYLRALREPLGTLDLSLARYAELVANPLPGDPQWLNTMAFVLVAWALASDDVEALTPTDRYAELHVACVGATGLLDAAAHEQAPNLDDWFSGAADAVDLSGFDLGLLQARYAEAEPALTDCTDQLDAAAAEAGL
jgi:endonuclease YncB( thermonuclease family)